MVSDYFDEGDILEIRGMKFQVLRVSHEIDFDNDNYTEFSDFYLHVFGSKFLHPTHLMRFKEDGKITFFRIKEEKNSKGLRRPKIQDGAFLFSEEIVLDSCDIKRVG